MLWDRIKGRFVIIFSMLALIMAGCSDSDPMTPEISATGTDSEIQMQAESDDEEAVHIAAAVRDIYEEAMEADALGNLDTIQRMVARLGEHGYAAVDSENQVDMTEAGQVTAFCNSVDAKEEAELTIIVVTDTGGFRIYNLTTAEGSVTVVRGSYQLENGSLKNTETVSFTAESWKYTEEGYLLFEGSYYSENYYVLTLSDVLEQAALRVQPLDQTCREFNRKYILPIGYQKNNLFLTDWSEEEFGELDFYDIFDGFYPILNKQPVPYAADENLGAETVYQVPEELFEHVIMTYFKIDRDELRSKTIYYSEEASYVYKPRGIDEIDYLDIPYPEVVSYTENQDGTITLIVNAVYPNEMTANSFSHKTVIRPLDHGGFQYVSNQMLSPKEEYRIWWHSDRLTGDEWEADGLLTEEEQYELKNTAWTAAERVKEVYQDIELMDGASYGSNIKSFSIEQRREVVTLLGQAGFVSVTEDTNMENYTEVEAFYAAYMEKQDAMVTIFEVNRDGLIGAKTFCCRDGRIQTYYIGIGWQEGGIPEVRAPFVRNVSELKLTEKGYLIYAYEDVIAHASLRQYWRVKPLSDKCRELTANYIYGLSYVNYNVLVTDWDSRNVEDILMPCMFEDIYWIDTGEILRADHGRIPAELFEKIMTAYLPVTKEQLRETCGYDSESDSYAYEKISANPYSPFGEVVDYTEHADGTITLIVDGVWPDYNSDCAFTNTILVQPFADGTFRLLSNSIEQKELELPPIARR